MASKETPAAPPPASAKVVATADTSPSSVLVAGDTPSIFDMPNTRRALFFVESAAAAAVAAAIDGDAQDSVAEERSYTTAAAAAATTTATATTSIRMALSATTKTDTGGSAAAVAAIAMELDVGEPPNSSMDTDPPTESARTAAATKVNQQALGGGTVVGEGALLLERRPSTTTSMMRNMPRAARFSQAPPPRTPPPPPPPPPPQSSSPATLRSLVRVEEKISRDIGGNLSGVTPAERAQARDSEWKWEGWEGEEDSDDEEEEEEVEIIWASQGRQEEEEEEEEEEEDGGKPRLAARFLQLSRAARKKSPEPQNGKGEQHAPNATTPAAAAAVTINSTTAAPAPNPTRRNNCSCRDTTTAPPSRDITGYAFKMTASLKEAFRCAVGDERDKRRARESTRAAAAAARERAAAAARAVCDLDAELEATYRESVEPAARELERLEKTWRQREGDMAKAASNACTAANMLRQAERTALLTERKLAAAEAAAVKAAAATVQRTHGDAASAEQQPHHELPQQLPPRDGDDFEGRAGGAVHAERATRATAAAEAADEKVRAVALEVAREGAKLARAQAEEVQAAVERTAYLVDVEAVERFFLADEVSDAVVALAKAKESYEALAVQAGAARAEEQAARKEGLAALFRCIVPYQEYLGALNRTSRARGTHNMSVGRGGDASAKTRCIVDRGPSGPKSAEAAGCSKGGDDGGCNNDGGGGCNNGGDGSSNRGCCSTSDSGCCLGDGGGGCSNGTKRGLEGTDAAAVHADGGCGGKVAGGAGGAGEEAGGSGKQDTKQVLPNAKVKGKGKGKGKVTWGEAEELEDMFDEPEQEEERRGSVRRHLGVFVTKPSVRSSWKGRTISSTPRLTSLHASC